MVFIWGGLGLAFIELLRALARRSEAAREARRDGAQPGLYSARLHRDFERPTFRMRRRIAWAVVGGCGFVALIALLVNKA